MLQTLLTSAVAFGGIVIGAFLQHWFLKLNAKDNKLREERQKAYSDFLKGVALSATSQDAEAWALVADAKSRIAIYGSNIVIEKLAVLDRCGFMLNNEKSNLAFIKLIQQMREDSFADGVSVSANDLKTILLGKVF